MESYSPCQSRVIYHPPRTINYPMPVARPFEVPMTIPYYTPAPVYNVHQNIIRVTPFDAPYPVSRPHIQRVCYPVHVHTNTYSYAYGSSVPAGYDPRYLQ